MATVDKYLKMVLDSGGSDLHVVAGLPIKIRLHGELEPLQMAPMGAEDTERLLLEIMDRWDREEFRQRNEIDFAYEVKGLARFRVNFFQHRNGMGGVFRIIPHNIHSMQDLNLPRTLERFAQLRSGLVLVTGPTGSGKSTTLAAIIDYINTNSHRHMVTIEDPIEYMHGNKKSVITQREIGRDTETFAAALRAATRQDADVILVGEMRDRESIGLALSLAEMGTVVFGTLHTNNAGKTVDRIIDVFPEEQQGQIRSQLSLSLRGVCSQLLLKRRDKRGRVPVNEILFGCTSLSNMIREGGTHKISSLIESSRGEGMQLMDDSIFSRLEDGLITRGEALRYGIDKNRFESFVEGHRTIQGK